MNDESLNMSIRKFLKTVGVNSQLAIEKAVADVAERCRSLRPGFGRIGHNRAADIFRRQLQPIAGKLRDRAVVKQQLVIGEAGNVVRIAGAKGQCVGRRPARLDLESTESLFAGIRQGKPIEPGLVGNAYCCAEQRPCRFGGDRFAKAYPFVTKPCRVAMDIE